MTFHKFYIAIAALLFIPLSMSAAPQRRLRGLSNSSDMKMVRRYTDSLLLFRDSLYRDSVHAETIKPIDTAPYFLPFTFYEGVTDHAFSLDKKLSVTDSTLLSFYLSHPEWVENTQRRLETTGPVIRPKTVRESPTEVIEKELPKEPEHQPVDLIVFKPNFWSFGGDYYLQFLQNYLSDNWYQGGESKRYTGKLGLQAANRWYYTFQLIAQTQWARHYSTNSNYVQSDLFSPLNVNVSVGMDYSVNWLKGRLKGSVHLAPFAYNFKYVGRLSLAQNNGIDAGHHSLNDFGSQTTIDLTWNFADNISWKTRLYGYTTYKRTEAEWENTFSFQFNRYLATKISLYPRFDDGRKRDDKLGYWMLREYFSIGFSYSM